MPDRRSSAGMAAPLCVTVLAAGKGTRMRNALPKVLHPLAGRTLIEHVLASAAELAPDRAVVVLAPEMERGGGRAGRSPLAPAIVVQEPQLGTGHALKAARRPCRPAARCSCCSATRRCSPADPGAAGRGRAGGGCGRGGARHAADRSGGLWPAALDGRRLVESSRTVMPTPALKRERLCNSGVMAFDAARLPELLDALPLRPRQGRVLPHRHGGAGGGARLGLRRDRGAGRGGPGRQLAGAAGRGARRPAAAPAARLLEAGVIMPAPGDGPSLRRHRDRSRAR